MKKTKDFLGVIEQNINFILLLALIIIAIIIHVCASTRLESIGVIFSPLFTLLIFRIVEDRKIKWNSKYEAFKTLYANRGQLLDSTPNYINETTVNVFNSIDILFIEDANVRNCWKNLLDNLYRENPDMNERKAIMIDLLTAMAESLGIKGDNKYTDISRTYYPTYLGRNREMSEFREQKKEEYYINGSLFFKNSVPSSNGLIDSK